MVSALEEHLFKGVKLKPNSLLITFDDGDVSVLDYGLPLLKIYHVPSVRFIITGLIDTENTFWCKWLEIALQNEENSYFEARKVVNQLKKLSNKDRVEYLSKLRTIKTRQLSKNDILKMQSENMFVGNHTHTHPMVDRCTSDELTNELEYSRDCFNKWNISGYFIFTYPNGNFDDNSEKILKDNGIKMAFLFDHKLNKKKIDPMRISRIRVNSDAELNEFKVKVSGPHSKLMELKQKIS